MTYSWLDIVLIILPTLGAVAGFRHGMVKEISGVIGLFAAVYGAINFSDVAARYLRPHVEWTDTMLSFAAFVMVLFGILLIMALFAKLIDSLLQFLALGSLNKIIGVFIGAAKGFLWLGILLIIVDTIDRKISIIPEDARNNSIMYEPLRGFALGVFPQISDADWFEQIRETTEKPEVEV
jgi:membrane protein required for colicin V production